MKRRVVCVVGSDFVELFREQKTSVLDASYYKGHGGPYQTRPHVMEIIVDDDTLRTCAYEWIAEGT